MSPRARRRWRWWLIGGIAVALALVIGGPFVYFHFIEGSPPPRFTLSHSPGSGPTPATADGHWSVGSGSRAGYRVGEVLFGQSQDAVGRTSAVKGAMTIARSRVTAATVTVDLTKVTSDRSQRDRQFQGRIMDTARYPTATFTLTDPVALGSSVNGKTTLRVNAVGQLDVHGTKRSATAQLRARHEGNTIQVAGSIPITFADWNIPNPSFGPATTQDHGVIEFLLAFEQA
jgi:polyisoprenoid-binding protein YceI